MPQASEPVGSLRNIGPTIAKNLHLIGIRTKADLQQASAVGAYLHLTSSFPHKTWPVCYYLYSLQGALQDEHWDDIGEAAKAQLLGEVRRRQSLVGAAATG